MDELWGIDHTLIETGGVGAEVFKDAFEQVTSHHIDRLADVTGRTEQVIFRETPTGVHIHATSIEIKAGVSVEGLSIADRTDVSSSPTLERQTTFYLELARLHE